MTLIEQIVHSPRLPQYVRELEGILDAENVRRERFYEELRDDQKAEFINGEVFVHSPVKFEHNDVSVQLLKLLAVHVQRHSLGAVGHEKLLVVLTRNDYEPDICFWGKPKAAKLKRDQMKFPAPDLIVEVLSPSTQDHDRGIKFEDYAAHGVREYWIVDPVRRAVEQYLLDGERYKLENKSREGTIKSRVVKGFEIPVRAVFDSRENLKALRRIMA